MEKKSKAQLFKRLIKEAVREVLQEEIGDIREIIQEELQNIRPLLTERKKVTRTEIEIKNGSTPATNRTNPYEAFLPGYAQVKARQQAMQQQVVPNKPQSVMDKLLAETAKNMTSEDFNTHTNTGNVESMSMPMPQQGMGAMSQDMMNSIGEIEEWEPTNVGMPAPPIR